MKIVVGLGNPGREYAMTRHNAGFMVVDRLAALHSLSFSRRKFKSKIAAGTISGSEVVLVKPQTYMNVSGEAVGALFRFYRRSPSDVLVIHDDIDIRFGNLRLRPAGGSGGHKGMASIIAHLGTDAVPRLRVGIRSASPVGDLSDYVLRKFTVGEQAELNNIIERACEAVETVLTESFQTAMNRFN